MRELATPFEQGIMASDPLADMIPDPPPRDEEEEARPYQPARPSALRRAVLVSAWTAAALILIGTPLLYYFADIDLFGNPDHWREQPFVNSAGGSSMAFYTGRVTRAEAKRLADFLQKEAGYGGPDGVTVIADQHEGAYTLTLFVNLSVDGPDWPALRSYFDHLRERISAEVFEGKPLGLELCEPTIKVIPGKVVKRVLVRIP